MKAKSLAKAFNQNNNDFATPTSKHGSAVKAEDRLFLTIINDESRGATVGTEAVVFISQTHILYALAD